MYGRSRDVGERGRPQLSSEQRMQLVVEALLVQLSHRSFYLNNRLVKY